MRKLLALLLVAPAIAWGQLGQFSKPPSFNSASVGTISGTTAQFTSLGINRAPTVLLDVFNGGSAGTTADDATVAAVSTNRNAKFTLDSGATNSSSLVFNAGGVAKATLSYNASTSIFSSSTPLQITTGALANQLRMAQTTAPTCSANCGTSPSIAGTDTAGIVTMGASGVPASAWVVTFNGTWAAAPSCIVQSALASMVVGKMPIAVVVSTTTITVTTNGTAPSVSDKYQYHCIGVS